MDMAKPSDAVFEREFLHQSIPSSRLAIRAVSTGFAHASTAGSAHVSIGNAHVSVDDVSTGNVNAHVSVDDVSTGKWTWPSPPKLSRAHYRKVRHGEKVLKAKRCPPKTRPFVQFKSELD